MLYLDAGTTYSKIISDTELFYGKDTVYSENNRN